jgi:GNAT superfamily N-acetyltransferase
MTTIVPEVITTVSVRYMDIVDCHHRFRETLSHLKPSAINIPLWKLQESYGNMLANPIYYILVAEIDGEIVGTLTLVFEKDRPFGPTIRLEEVVTHKDYQDKGVMRALMDRAEELATQLRGYKGAFLLCYFMIFLQFFNITTSYQIYFCLILLSITSFGNKTFNDIFSMISTLSSFNRFI